jgi:uncharacterized protein (DUF983 family)
MLMDMRMGQRAMSKVNRSCPDCGKEYKQEDFFRQSPQCKECWRKIYMSWFRDIKNDNT